MDPLPIVFVLSLLSSSRCTTPFPHGLPATRDIARCAATRSHEVHLPRTVPANSQAASAASISGQSRGSSRFLRAWSQIARDTEAKEPEWLSPIATTSGRLKQEFRFDMWRQISPSGATNYTLGGGKGLELIVDSRLQVMAGIPSYVAHTSSGTRDGFGDLPLMLKIRLASAPEGEGDYILTLLLSATVPTGSRAVGMHSNVLSPAIAFGKGWGRFDVQATLGPNLPAGDTTRLGRQLLWNTTLQYHTKWMLWPEAEVNSTSYLTGKNAGDTQTFLTPGLGFGRKRLGKDLRLSAAVGLQIAVTPFHTYNHQWMASSRLNF